MARIPDRSTTGGRVFNDLRNLARRQRRNTQGLLVTYTLERWLYRLSLSTCANTFLLKGGCFLRHSVRAGLPAMPICLSADTKADQATITRYVLDVATITIDDGVSFDSNSVRVTTIREGEHYTGTRLVVTASIAQAVTQLSLDISLGDPVTPGAVVTAYPQALADETFSLYAYPIETVLAEKITTAIDLGAENTRERDYADVWRLTEQHRLDSQKVKAAFAQTASWRGVASRSITELVEELGRRRQTAYTAWLNRQTADRDNYPTTYRDVAKEVAAFAEPIINNTASGNWNPKTRRWDPNDPERL
ncbi:MAG: nucleotidyl transferase AbiEii/AbiGii toxin family protein [Acidimicrobiales bacterium]|nr:MAG: nucleotidyl transferase AbiEii/AbiGii toxin family protein [Acidimicrobiales bacterium]